MKKPKPPKRLREKRQQSRLAALRRLDAMPLTAKGEKIKRAMEEEYGKEKGERVFYASKNKGTISGVDSAIDAIMAECDRLQKRFDAMEARRIAGEK